MLIVKILKEKLYNKYSRKELSEKMNLSETHISRLLNEQSEMTIKQFQNFNNLLE